MTQPDPRSALTNGLRNLADYLDTSPVPVPTGPRELLVFVDTYGELVEIAHALGVEVTQSKNRRGHFTATREFGPVSYQAVLIDRTGLAAYDHQLAQHAAGAR